MVTSLPQETIAIARRILLVEDDADLRDSLADVLRTEGYDVVGAANGAEALDYLRHAAPPDLIVLDLMMPIMDGWQFRDAQERDPALSSIPVLVVSADESPRAAALSASDFLAKPFEFSGLLKAVGRIMDGVHHGRQQTERRAHSDRMASLGMLAAGIAHEINNPLAYVMANLGFVRDALGDVIRVSRAVTDPSNAASVAPESEIGAAAKTLPSRIDELQAAIDEAIDGAERIRRIVRDVKAVSTVDDSRREVLDVRTVLESSLNIVANEIRHRARLVKDFKPTPRVEANAGRLGQVFINLLINAAQAIREGSASKNEIRVATRTDDAGRVVVEISDTGEGIADAVRGRIFEPFFTTKPVGVGSGLGLSISHGIIRSIGGEITFESEAGKGTTFRVILRPNRRDTHPVRLEAVGSTSPVPRARILIIDDDTGVQRALKRMLEYDHEVVFAGSGKVALDIVQRDNAFDVIFCDLMMPEVTGMDFYETLVESAPDLAARIVFLTGGGFTPRAHEFIDRLTTPPLTKPIDPAALRSALKQKLRLKKKA